MARAVFSEQLTPADALRDLLSRVERLLGSVDTPGVEVVDLLDMRDQIAEQLPAMETSGMDLRPELGRLEGIDGGLHRKAGSITRQLRHKGGIEVTRERNPPSDRWWWFLDQEVAESRRRTMIRWGISTAAAVAAIAVILVVLNSLGPKDPKVRQALALRQQAENQVSTGYYEKAIANYQQVAALDPTDAESRIWLGVLYEKTGKPTDAEAQFAAAQKLTDLVNFLSTRANSYLLSGEPAKAKTDAEAVIQQSPDNGMAYFVLGGALEAQGDAQGAVKAFEQAATLSQDKNPNLYVMSRVRMGYLLQSPDLNTTPTPTPGS